MRFLNKFQFALVGFFLTISLSMQGFAEVDRSAVDRVKEWSKRDDDRSLAELRFATPLEFCAALNEIRRELGDSSALRALTYDQDVVLDRKGFAGYKCPRNLREIALWRQTSKNTDGVRTDFSGARETPVVATQPVEAYHPFDSAPSCLFCRMHEDGGDAYKPTTNYPSARTDSDWDWDYQPANRQWVCRGIQTGRYASPDRCAMDLKDDNRWPG